MPKKVVCVAQEGGNFRICGTQITDDKPVTLDLNRIVRRHLADGSIVEYRETKSKKKPGPKPTRSEERGVEAILEGLNDDSNDTRGD